MALSSNRIFAGLFQALEKVKSPGDLVATQREMGRNREGLVLMDRANQKLYVVDFREVPIPQAESCGG